ncbi:hypothetical protein [Actinophytocola sp.]|uniref:hypothetical protein n=1 Tax=Actinophytocola sp. TaxID=1872138 RepID=UPI002ED44583
MKRSRLLLLGATLAAGLITTSAIALPVAPAHAVANPEVESRQSANNTQSVKELSVPCDQGEFAYGGGGSITGGGAGNVALQAVVPVGNPPTAFRVRAAALGAVTGAWNVTAWAICGTFTAGLQVVPDSDGPNTVRSKETDSRCPTGMQMYGTGFEISPSGNGTVLVHDIIPGITLAPRSVTVRATARPNMTPNWSMDGFAICANPAATKRIDQAQLVPGSNPSRSVSKACENGSTFAHGLGAQTFGSDTNLDGRLALSSMFPPSNRSGGAIAGENGTVNENWQLQVYVICSI